MSNGFLGPLDLRAVEPGEWALLAPLLYRSEGEQLITVPDRFITDLASIPAPFRPVLDRNGQSRRPAVLHDWLYCLREGSRADADGLFLEALKSEGISLPIRWAMYLGVRAGGWLYWSRRSGIEEEDFLPGPAGRHG